MKSRSSRAEARLDATRKAGDERFSGAAIAAANRAGQLFVFKAAFEFQGTHKKDGTVTIEGRREVASEKKTTER